LPEADEEGNDGSCYHDRDEDVAVYFCLVKFSTGDCVLVVGVELLADLDCGVGFVTNATATQAFQVSLTWRL